MDTLSADFWSGLLAIVVIDLVLAGDNAIVIGMSARSLTPELQRKAILWGTVGAVVIRSGLTLAAVYLLTIPGLMAAGGLLLIWIAYKLIAEDKSHSGVEAKVARTFWEALRTILVADAVMGMDNVLAVAGAAHGDFLLVVLGLLISVPIVVWGSTLIVRLIERFPLLIYAGGGVLAFTAAKMIAGEKLLPWFEDSPTLRWAFAAAVVAGVLLAGRAGRKRAEPAS